MKTIRTFCILLIITSFLLVSAIAGADWEADEAVNRLLSIQEPGSPIIQGNSVIFTADSAHRRVGVAFAHESFSTVYWFTKLLVPQDRINPVILPGQKFPDPFKDSGIQFYIYTVPEQMNDLEYRLIINGLWTTDPSNSNVRKDPSSGLSMSVINLPPRAINLNPARGLPEGLHFTFKGPPGETVTVAGSFNAWDPFMFELKEGPAGTYTLTLPLPPGTYQYVFFHRGQRLLDVNNGRRAYLRDGSAVSEVIIPN
ncbi:MAG: isoamylase [Treponema sp.]|jgi:hypothetical protein|nr:isoamylase [Treponema sp.]